MAQSSVGTIDPDATSGEALAEILSDDLAAKNSTHAGASQPTYAVAGMLWMDNTTGNLILKLVDAGTNDIFVVQLDAANNCIRHVLDADGDTWWSAPTDDKAKATVGGTDVLQILPTGIQTLLAQHDIFDANGNLNARYSKVASAVNAIEFTNSATGNAVTIKPVGTDTNIDVEITGKGSGRPKIQGQLHGVSAKSANYTIVAPTDRSSLIHATAALTLSLPAAASAGNGFFFTVKADGGNVTLDPNGSETVDGAATIMVFDGETVNVWCTGSAWQTDKRSFWTGESEEIQVGNGFVRNSGTNASLAHGLGAIPSFYEAVAVCKIADSSYSPGDEIKLGAYFANGGNIYGLSLSVDATTFTIVIGASGLVAHSKSSGGAVAALTSTSWRLVVRWRA